MIQLRDQGSDSYPARKQQRPESKWGLGPTPGAHSRPVMLPQALLSLGVAKLSCGLARLPDLSSSQKAGFPFSPCARRLPQWTVSRHLQFLLRRPRIIIKQHLVQLNTPVVPNSYVETYPPV